MKSEESDVDLPAPVAGPNPKRVLAGRANGKLAGPITEVERERRRLAILTQKPWLLSTGPRTFTGKQKSAQNARRRDQQPTQPDLQTRISMVASHMHSLRHKPLLQLASLELTSGTLLRDLLVANLADINRSVIRSTSQNLLAKGTAESK